MPNSTIRFITFDFSSSSSSFPVTIIQTQAPTMHRNLYIFADGLVRNEYIFVKTLVCITLASTDVASRAVQLVKYLFLHRPPLALHFYNKKVSNKLALFLFVSLFSQTNYETFYRRTSCKIQDIVEIRVNFVTKFQCRSELSYDLCT